MKFKAKLQMPDGTIKVSTVEGPSLAAVQSGAEKRGIAILAIRELEAKPEAIAPAVDGAMQEEEPEESVPLMDLPPDIYGIIMHRNRNSKGFLLATALSVLFPLLLFISIPLSIFAIIGRRRDEQLDKMQPYMEQILAMSRSDAQAYRLSDMGDLSLVGEYRLYRTRDWMPILFIPIIAVLAVIIVTLVSLTE